MHVGYESKHNGAYSDQPLGAFATQSEWEEFLYAIG